jgi:hypothetical protein
MYKRKGNLFLKLSLVLSLMSKSSKSCTLQNKTEIKKMLRLEYFTLSIWQSYICHSHH